MLRSSLIGIAIFGAFVLSPTSAVAGPKDFRKGPVFTEFGEVASIETDMKIPKRTKFKVAFDSAKETEAGKVNRTLNSVARFVNMHAASGVAEKNLKVAVVFHGAAAFDLTKNAYYTKTFENAENGNAAIVKALTDKGVRIILCGQTAVYRGISKEDLLPGVDMALSAMTAHALLQQEGYTLNPF